MLPPHELKNKSFQKAMRGYNPVEVDEYIEFLIEKYTELYRENDELERKLKSTVARLDELKSEEDEIRSTLIEAKRAANKIKADAEERAEAIVRSAKSSCNTILADFNTKIELGRDTIADLQRDAFALKQELFERYSEHIIMIEKLTEGMDESLIPEPSELRRQAVGAIKNDIAGMYSAPEADETPANTEDYEEPASEEVSYDDIEQPAEEPIDDTDTFIVDREPLIGGSKLGLKDSARELGKIFKDSDDTVINTPDSDVDDASYLDFVKSVTTKNETNTAKEADFDMLFDDSQKHKKKKKK